MKPRTEEQFDEGAPARVCTGDRMIEYFASSPSPQIAIAIAARIELRCALEWQREQKAMFDAGEEGSWGFQIFPDDVREAQAAFMNTPLFGTPLDAKAFTEWNKWDDDAPPTRRRAKDCTSTMEKLVLDWLSRFDADERWAIARRVRLALMELPEFRGL